MTPIAEKDFGIDSDTGLQKKLQVWAFYCDAETELITVVFKVVLISPTGKTVSVVRSGSYSRSGVKFNELRTSQIGQGIEYKISGDIDMITSYDKIDEDLKQTS